MTLHDGSPVPRPGQAAGRLARDARAPENPTRRGAGMFIPAPRPHLSDPVVVQGTFAMAMPQGDEPPGIVFFTVNVATSTTVTSFPGPFAV